MADLLILAHGGPWERRFQVVSLAASAAAAGRSVEIALFFDGLKRWVEGAWDAVDPSPPLERETVERLDLPPLTGLLAPGRKAGRIQLLGCSASMRCLGLEPAAVDAAVDVILGWQSLAGRVEAAASVVTL